MSSYFSSLYNSLPSVPSWVKDNAGAVAVGATSAVALVVTAPGIVVPALAGTLVLGSAAYVAAEPVKKLATEQMDQLIQQGKQTVQTVLTGQQPSTISPNDSHVVQEVITGLKKLQKNLSRGNKPNFKGLLILASNLSKLNNPKVQIFAQKISLIADNRSGRDAITAAEVQEILKIVEPQTITSSQLEQNNQLAIRQRTVTPVASPLALPANILEGINDQVTALKANLTMFVLGQLVLEDSTLVMSLIESFNHPDNKLTFKDIVFNRIDLNDNISSKSWAKFIYEFCESIVTFFISGIINKVKDDILNFIKMDREKQLDVIRNIFLDPTGDFLTTLSSLYDYLAKDPKPKTQTIKKYIEASAALPPEGVLQPSETNAHLVSLLLSKYISSITYEKFWILSFLINPFLESKLNGYIPTILKSSKDAMGVGGAYLHTINQLCYNTLVALQDNASQSLTKPKRALPLSDIDKTSIDTLVEALFRALDWQSKDTGDLSMLKPSEAPQGVAAGLNDQILKPIKGVVKQQIVSLIETLLQKEKLQMVVFNVFSSTNGMFKPLPLPTPDEMARTKQNLHQTLNQLAEKAVQQTVTTLLNPSEPIQNAANGFIDDFKDLISSFVADAQAHDQDITALKKAHDQLMLDINELQRRAKSETNPAAMRIIDDHIRRFMALSEVISTKINRRSELEKEKKELQDQHTALRDLSAILVDTSLTPEQKNTRIQKLDLLHYPYTIQPVISAAQKTGTYSREQENQLQAEINNLANRIAILNREIARNHLTAAELKEIQNFEQQLKHFTCEVQNSTILSLVGNVAGAPAVQVVASAIKSTVVEVFKLLSRDHFWSGASLRIADSYLKSEKPELAPKRKEISMQHWIHNLENYKPPEKEKSLMELAVDLFVPTAAKEIAGKIAPGLGDWTITHLDEWWKGTT